MERPSLMYWLLALHLAITQANVFLDSVGLQQLRINEATQIADVSVFSPSDPVDSSLEKSLLTTNFIFTISKRHLIFTRLKDVRPPGRGVQDWNDADGTIGIPKDRALENAAYSLARHWLEEIGFDVAAMEKEHPPWIEHKDLPLKNHHETSGRFAVRWGRKGAVTGPDCAAEIQLNLRGERLVLIDVRRLQYLREPLPEVPDAEDINRLPDGPVRHILGLGPSQSVSVALRRPRFSFTNALQLLEIPSAYKDQMVQAMHTVASELALRLHCESAVDTARINLTEAYVNPPTFGSGGRLGAKGVEVRFDTAGRLMYLSCLPPGYTNSSHWEATAKLLISSNAAFEVASQAVIALSIDVARLDRDFERIFSQGSRMKRDTKGKRAQIPTPRFWLWWADTSAGRRRPVVVIGVCGDTGNIGMVDLRDTTYYHGPTLPTQPPRGFDEHGAAPFTPTLPEAKSSRDAVRR